MKLKKITYLYLFVWISGLLYASLTPPRNIPDFFHFKNIDKLVHFIMYLGLTVLLIPVLLKKDRYIKCYMLSFLIATAAGILMEFLQSSITKFRFGSTLDAVANLLGIITGIVLFELIIRKTRLKNLFFKT
ncbi:MAG: VanZ family protein [Prolixibacteraceae bacterium]|nr:VanZ family protein [Prolixibacteraceae bacterium]